MLRANASNDDAVAQDLVAANLHEIAFANRVEEVGADPVDQRDAGPGEHRRSRVRVPAGDRCPGVHNRSGMALDQPFRRHAVEVFVVDQGDLAGLETRDQVLRPAIDAGDAADPGAVPAAAPGQPAGAGPDAVPLGPCHGANGSRRAV